MGKTVYCLSNGSELQFPNNTLTSFGNKFPFFLDYQKLTDNYKFHIAVEGIGFSLNFERMFLPKNLRNPSIILVLKTALRQPSKCISLQAGTNHICDTVFFDYILEQNAISKNDSYVYLYLETNDLQYDNLSKFFLDLPSYLDLIVVHGIEKK